MFVLDGGVIYSPTDLVVAMQCELALLRRLDVRLGRAEDVSVDDPLMARAALLGDSHERRVLDAYRATYGEHTPGTPGGVAEFPSQGDYSSAAALAASRDASLQALRDGADVVYQGSFFDGRFHGRSDFVVRRDDRYVVLDTKLARHAKVPALLQLAAYADQLQRHEIPLDPAVGLVLGNGEHPEFPVHDLLPVYRRRRARMQDLLDVHHAAADAVAWGAPGVRACGRCDVCQAEVEAHRDVLLVAGLRVTQRVRLHEAGITTIEELAASDQPVPGIGVGALDRLRNQARLQCVQDGLAPLPDGRPQVQHEVCDEAPLRALPLPDPGDLFFDFEGDPLWDCRDGHAGLEYLFGAIEADTGKFRHFLAHDRAQEKQALVDFLDYVAERRAKHPSMRIYHYAAYEKAALTRLAARHQGGEEFVDDLLRQGVLVDLYSTVRAAVRVSQPSYSIKKLEPLYMGDQLRSGVDNAAESVVEYARYTALVEEGETEEAHTVLKGILDYNEYDCLSTWKLRDWLCSLVPHETEAPAPLHDDQTTPIAVDPVADELLERAEAGDPDAAALRMLSACLGYHQREDKPFWWAHYARLREPIHDWADTKDVFVVEDVLRDSGWQAPAGRGNQTRTLVLAGAWGAGSVPNGKAVPVFAAPVPDGFEVPADGCRAAGSDCAIATPVIDGEAREVVELTLKLKNGQSPYLPTPVALVPCGGPRTDGIQTALHELAVSTLQHGLPQQPGMALLRRLTDADGQGSLEPVGEGKDATVLAVTESVRRRAGSYVAVQGPPGTGKTYVGSHVVKRLVDEGWRVGVVAQSHSVVCHFLDAVVKAGVPAARVAQNSNGTVNMATATKPDAFAGFLAAHRDLGCVVGGTVWDFVNLRRVGRAELDLLVVDEAGQFCVANTLAASVGAQRLLLLGDPQQLPQVSQGTHPEPVDDSALGWLMDGAATLPAELGYFLPETWRMHPALTAKVSELSYDGRLHSHQPATAARHLDGIEPGLHVVPVEHDGNSVCSREEAAEVVRLARSALGLRWTPSAEDPERALTQDNVLVVAAYNAQVNEIRHQLRAAGLADVLVGTVDKLQGREAPVVIVSLAASSAADVPRGMDFLLSRNRLNVAVSRAQWTTYLVHSPTLADFLPGTPDGLLQLGAYLRLHQPS